jgi:NAD(P)-dependent dehydrogenase (short-subunit alcohol dehydrogenase family)
MTTPSPSSIAIVTGAGSGIGAAAAIRLSGDGYTVVAIDRNAAALERTVEAATAAGGDCAASVLDVSDRAAVFAALAPLPRIDVVVNCAMWIRYGHITSLEEDTVDGMLGVGLKANLWTTQAAYEPMRAQGGGVIVHMSSPAAMHGFPGASIYSAIKGAVASLTRQSAVELAPDGIRVNAVVPGSVPTEGAAAVVDEAGFEYRRSRTPLGRLGTVEDIAGCISFLASADAAFITGHLLVVDGGITIA